MVDEYDTGENDTFEAHRQWNVSAGTSVFGMVVMEHEL